MYKSHVLYRAEDTANPPVSWSRRYRGTITSGAFVCLTAAVYSSLPR